MPWVTASSSTAPWGWSSYQDFNWVTDPKLPIWYGQQPDTPQSYSFAGWTGLNWDSNFYQTANDLDHASDFLLGIYSPPQMITVTRSAVDYEYEFVRMGGAPRCEDVDVPIPITTPAGDIYDFTYSTNGENILAVVYRLVGLA